jgi:hypothetical protein
MGKDNMYISSLEMLGYEVRNMERIERKAFTDDMFRDIIKSVTLIETWDAIDILKKHVYCGNDIVEMICNA